MSYSSGMWVRMITFFNLSACLAARDLRARYRNAAAGYLWAVIQPLMMTAVLALAYHVMLPTRAEAGIRQPALGILCRLMLWQFVTTALPSAIRTPIDHRELLLTSRFPREILPLASVLNALVNLGLCGAAFLAVHGVLAGFPPIRPALLLGSLLVAMALVYGLALIGAAAQVRLRDTAHLLDTALLMLFFASPVMYPPAFALERLSHPWSLVYRANPLAGLIGSWQNAWMASEPPDMTMLLWPAIASLFILVLGVFTYRHTSATFADYL